MTTMPGAIVPSVLAGASPTLRVLEELAQLADAGLLLALLLLGGVVAAVLAQVALLAGLLDLARDLGTALAGEMIELRLEAVVGLLGQPGDAAWSRSRRAPITVRTAVVGRGNDRGYQRVSDGRRRRRRRPSPAGWSARCAVGGRPAGRGRDDRRRPSQPDDGAGGRRSPGTAQTAGCPPAWEHVERRPARRRARRRRRRCPARSSDDRVEREPPAQHRPARPRARTTRQRRDQQPAPAAGDGAAAVPLVERRARDVAAAARAVGAEPRGRRLDVLTCLPDVARRRRFGDDCPSARRQPAAAPRRSRRWPRSLRLLAVHAHPDDESSKGAATMARYVAEGARVLVATCTGGERGDILNPALRATPTCCATWPSSAGTRWPGPPPSSASSTAGWASSTPACPRATRCRRCRRAASRCEPLETAAAPLVRLVREFRPHVITTYDENGGYPHPDHIMCHKISVRGVRGRRPTRTATRAPGEPWQPLKLYYDRGFSRERSMAFHEAMLAQGLESPFAEWLERWTEERAARPAPRPR